MATKRLDASARRRLQAGRMLLAGKTSAEAAHIVGVARQTAYAWKAVLDNGGIDALQAMPTRGRPARLDDERLQALGRVRLSPNFGVHGVRHRKKGRGVLCAGCVARYAWIRSMKVRWPITVMYEVLEVCPSGYFHWEASRRCPEAGTRRRHSVEALVAYIRAIHAQLRGEYGCPGMHKELLARGVRVGKERVRLLMRQHGSRAKGKKKFVVTTDSKHHLRRRPT